jgi:hypothetical protein
MRKRKTSRALRVGLSDEPLPEGMTMAQAKVLRLLRHDARSWWWFRRLREMGRVDEAIKLERQSIRNDVTFIRENVGRRAITYRTSVISFEDTPRAKPFDLQPVNGRGHTTCLSGCHPGIFAAWIYCYAHRIGLKFTAKQYDMV